jgi:hypothetical protein
MCLTVPGWAFVNRNHAGRARAGYHPPNDNSHVASMARNRWNLRDMAEVVHSESPVAIPSYSFFSTYQNHLETAHYCN